MNEDRDIPDKTCRYCWYWSPYHEDNPDDSVGKCKANFMSQFIYPVDSKDKDILHYTLDTFPNFGCIHHEFKETP